MANTPVVEKALFTNTGESIADVVQRVYETAPSGPINSAIGNTFFGINHRQQPSAISINKDNFGLTFFTRPRLNLTTENLRTVRMFTPLLSTESASYQRIIRCLLDPELAWGNKQISSPFVDPSQAFIPVLSNHLLSMTGWPDLDAPTYTSHEGHAKEAFSIIDGITQNYTTYDITANFRNLPGDPISLLFLAWIHYASNVYLGNMVPYPDAIIQQEIDYNTRIYRLVLDPAKRKVQKICATGAAFPSSVPIGASFAFEAGQPLNQGLEQITINFKSMGFMYNDDILCDEFNRTTVLFNPGMKDSLRDHYYKLIPYDALPIFNHRGYPRINLDNYELEWYVAIEDFNQRLPAYAEWLKLNKPR